MQTLRFQFRKTIANDADYEVNVRRVSIELPVVRAPEAVSPAESLIRERDLAPESLTACGRLVLALDERGTMDPISLARRSVPKGGFMRANAPREQVLGRGQQA